METAPTVRRAAQGDVEALGFLCGALGYATDSSAMAERFAAVARSSSDILLVAEMSGSVIGWLQAHAAWVLETGFRVEIVGLIISPESRRAGVGRALVAAAERWAEDLGAVSIVVRSNAQRVESHAFYPAIGYMRKKTQEVYWKTLNKPNRSLDPRHGAD
jgi:GNAT superfamily N-acetyltransferase